MEESKLGDGVWVDAAHHCPHVLGESLDDSVASVAESRGIELFPAACNLSQIGETLFGQSCSGTDDDECENKQENWVCLKCHRVLCGRYAKQHALKHFQNDNSHCIVIGLADLSVWCYRCESYLHHLNMRLVYDMYCQFHLMKFGKRAAVPFTHDSSDDDSDEKR